MDGKNNARNRINYLVDLVIGVGFAVAIISGLVLLFAGPGGYRGGRNPHFAREVLLLSRWVWKDLHNWSGLVMLGGVFLHLALHWKWILCMTRNLLRPRTRASNCPVQG